MHKRPSNPRRITPPAERLGPEVTIAMVARALVARDATPLEFWRSTVPPDRWSIYAQSNLSTYCRVVGSGAEATS